LNLECQLRALRLQTLLQFDGKLAGARCEEHAAAVAAGKRKADHLGVMLDRLLDIRCLEGGMAEPQ
jgi:hypothetical protein